MARMPALEVVRAQAVDQSRWVREDETAVVGAGTRSVGEDVGREDAKKLFIAGIESLPVAVDELDVLLHGGAASDEIAAAAGRALGLEVVCYEPNWGWTAHEACVVREGQYGPYNAAAGPWRNRVLAADGDCLVALWDGESSGTEGMLELALGEAEAVSERQIAPGRVRYLVYE